MNITVRKAKPSEQDAVLSLYRSLLGMPGCTWNTEYPSEEDVWRDLEKNALYVACDGEKIVAAAAAMPDNELADLPSWSRESKVPCELARVGVSAACQGQGIAGMLLSAIEEEMRGRGFDAVHLLVGQQNTRALRTYEKLGYRRAGETQMFAIDWFCYEKMLHA